MNTVTQPNTTMPQVFKGLPTDEQRHFATEIENLMATEGKVRCSFFGKDMDLDADDLDLFIEEHELENIPHWRALAEFSLYYADNRAEYKQNGGLW